MHLVSVFSFSFSSRWHRSARKGPYALHPVSQQSPQGCPRNSANICLVEHRSFSALEGGMSAASFLHSSFLQAVNAVMLWLVRVEKVPQASEHLCPAKLQTSCDICSACQCLASCVHGNEQRIALSIFVYIRTRFTLVLTTFTVAFASTTVFPLQNSCSSVIISLLTHGFICWLLA